MKKILFVAVFAFAFSFLNAQMEPAKSYDANKGLQFYMGLGGAYNNYKNLNNTFKDASLPTIGKFSLTSGAEIDLRNKNLLFGLNGDMGFSYKRTDDFNALLLNFGQELHVAYYVANSKNFHFAPQVGIGFLSSNVNLTQRKNIEDFNDVLTNGNSVSINQNVGVLDFSLRFDFADFTKPKSKSASIRVGYKHGLSSRGWGIDATSNSTIDNSPQDRINQGYILFSIGFAGQKPNRS